MRTMELGELRVRLVGGDDREGGGQGPMVVLMHGFGAPGDDLVPLWRQLRVPAGVRFAFPEAPLSLAAMFGHDARAWWMIDIARIEQALQRGELRDLRAEEPDGLAEARAMLEGTLEAMQSELGLRREQLVLGGFSQGAMLACDVVMRSQQPFAGLVMMSGTYLAESAWRGGMARRAGMPLLLSHGRQDPLLPFVVAEQLRDAFVEAGLDVRWMPFHGGHGIGGDVLAGVGKLVTDALAGDAGGG
jgi:phospholipase/carboxylesterase